MVHFIISREPVLFLTLYQRICKSEEPNRADGNLVRGSNTSVGDANKTNHVDNACIYPLVQVVQNLLDGLRCW